MPGNDGPMQVLVLGGYGLFGSRISRRLAGDDRFDVLVGGRDRAGAEAFIAAQAPPLRSRMRPLAIDTTAADFPARLAAAQPHIVIDTAGPFQARGLRVPQAALDCGAHCIDLADGRDYVQRIATLDAAARTARRRIVSGASSVPGLSAAVVAALAPRFARLDGIEAGISPGNRTPRGLATTQAILGYVGQPYPILRDGRWQQAHGWQSLRRVAFPQTGNRWLARCEVPDVDLLPRRWPQLRDCDFRAGLELRRMHFGLWLASWAVRAGIVRSMQPWASPLLRISERWQRLGSDTGAMHVDARGLDHAQRPLALRWWIAAHAGDGPEIPATAAVLLAKKLADGSLTGAGAGACIDLFALEEFLAELQPFAIRSGVLELPRSDHSTRSSQPS